MEAGLGRGKRTEMSEWESEKEKGREERKGG